MKLIFEDCFSCPAEMCESKSSLLNKVREVTFAVVELNLFLDTHPNNCEALALFKKLCANKEILLKEYQSKYGPLTACQSSETSPFEWVDDNYAWPWQKGAE